MHICKPKRGRYSEPTLIKNISSLPKYISCDNSNEFDHPRKIWWKREEMYIQKWQLTDEELEQAINEHDIFSLDMPDKFICPVCVKKSKEKAERKVDVIEK